MSAGAVFSLIASDGRADRLIMATQLLNERIRDVMGQRAGEPTLADIERSHTLYVNAHFRPYGAREMPFGVVVPQMGDFMRDMVGYVGRATPMSEYYRKRQARIELLRERERTKNARKKRNRRNRVRRQLVQLAHVLPGDLVAHIGSFLQAPIEK